MIFQTTRKQATLLTILLESQSSPSYKPSPDVAHALCIYLQKYAFGLVVRQCKKGLIFSRSKTEYNMYEYGQNPYKKYKTMFVKSRIYGLVGSNVRLLNLLLDISKYLLAKERGKKLLKRALVQLHLEKKNKELA